MATTLNGIILFVQDVDRLKHFYSNHFNLTVAEEITSEWVLLKAGHCELGLHKIGADYLKPGESTVRVDTNTKIVFDIDEDLFVIHRVLTEKNITLTEIKTWDNFPYWVCDGEDYEGNVFQLRMKKQAIP
jgi:catechol-2,3-dioxygenase